MILDEAHQLPDTATLFFGEQVDRRAAGGARARRRSRGAHRRARRAGAARRRRRRRPRDPQAAPGRWASTPGKLAQRDRGANARASPTALDALAAALDRLAAELAPLRRAQRGARQLRAPRATKPRGRLARWRDGRDADRRRPRATRRHGSAGSTSRRRAGSCTRRRCRSRRCSRRQVDESRPRVDLHVGDARGGRAISRSTSASWASTTRAPARGTVPFDYATQALLYVPRGLPRAEFARAHRRRGRRRAAGAAGERRPRVPAVHDAARARASRASCWPTAFAREGLDWPLLVQGEGSRSELLARFRELGNAVLLGSASFWEGVDVPGDALSLVVIDKLPFAPPDDPLLAARLDAAARRRAAIRSSTGSCRRRRSA